MTRDEHLRLNIDVGAHRGMELGALNNPTVRPEEGQIEFVDYGPTEVLKAQHAHLPDRVAGIVEVTHVWAGSGSLAAVVGGPDQFHYAIASHVIEHVPNILGWFRGIYEALKPGAVFNLAVPDMRYTFDVSRSESTLGELVEADLMNYRMPSIRQMFDSCSLAVAVEPGERWSTLTDGSDRPLFMGDIALRLAYDQARAIAASGIYFDSHCWVFTPIGLSKLLEDATKLGLFPFIVEDITSTGAGQFEFFVHLRKAATAVEQSADVRLTAVAAVRERLESERKRLRVASA